VLDFRPNPTPSAFYFRRGHLPSEPVIAFRGKSLKTQFAVNPLDAGLIP
jgi:hypothetical protein